MNNTDEIVNVHAAAVARRDLLLEMRDWQNFPAWEDESVELRRMAEWGERAKKICNVLYPEHE